MFTLGGIVVPAKPYDFDKTGRNQLIGLENILTDKWFKNNGGLSIKHSVTICKHFFIGSQVLIYLSPVSPWVLIEAMASALILTC